MEKSWNLILQSPILCFPIVKLNAHKIWLMINDNNNNNTYIAPISILLFSSALKNENIFKKILRLHKVYMHKVKIR